MKYPRLIIDDGHTWLLRRPYPGHTFQGLTAEQATRIVDCLERHATPSMRAALDFSDLAVSAHYCLDRFLARLGASVYINLVTSEVS